MTYASVTAPDAVLEALADPTRRAVFERVVAQPRSVTALADGLPVSRPAVSQHLKVLQTAGLVRVEPRGRERIYHPSGDGLGALRAWVEQQWTTVLGAFAQAAQELADTDRRQPEDQQ